MTQLIYAYPCKEVAFSKQRSCLLPRLRTMVNTILLQSSRLGLKNKYKTHNMSLLSLTKIEMAIIHFISNIIKISIFIIIKVEYIV